MKVLITLIALSLLSGCATTDMTGQLNRGMGNIPTTQYQMHKLLKKLESYDLKRSFL